MKTRLYQLKNSAYLLCSLLLLPLQGDTKENEPVFNWTENKFISESFSASAASTISVTNKYGDIEVENWDKDSVSFEINIVAQADEAQHAKALIRMVDIEFRSGGSQIEANLLWGKELNSVKRSAVDMMLSLKNNQRIEINFKIKIPKGAGLKIENRFGNLRLPELSGKCFLEVNHGDIRSPFLKDARSVYVRYGKVDIRKITTGNFDLGSADLTVEEADDITINSSNSDIIIEQVNSLNLKSSNDRINIESVQKVSGSTTLSNTRIRQLNHSINLSCRFGDLNVRHIASGFSGISVDGNLTDVTLTFESGTSFSYTVSLENGKSFSAPTGQSEYEENTVGKSKFINGKFGTGGAKKVNISLKASYVRLESAF